MQLPQEAKIRGSEVQGLPGLQSNFKMMLRKLMRSHLKRNKKRGRWEHLPILNKALGSVK